MISIAGRPSRRWAGETRVVGYSIHLRLDDDEDPEYWESITIDEEDLYRLVTDQGARLLASLFERYTREALASVVVIPEEVRAGPPPENPPLQSPTPT